MCTHDFSKKIHVIKVAHIKLIAPSVSYHFDHCCYAANETQPKIKTKQKKDCVPFIIIHTWHMHD